MRKHQEKIKTKLKTNDKVKILTGKDKGKVSKILKIIPKKNRAIVEKVNIIKRHTKPSQTNKQGGIIEKEAPIHCSNLILICPKCLKPTRISKVFLENNDKRRCCKKCNETID